MLLEIWWERVGHSKAGGIHKIVMAEVRNFPELAQFYADEVITPAERLFSGRSSAESHAVNSGSFPFLKQPTHCFGSDHLPAASISIPSQAAPSAPFRSTPEATLDARTCRPRAPRPRKCAPPKPPGAPHEAQDHLDRVGSAGRVLLAAGLGRALMARKRDGQPAACGGPCRHPRPGRGADTLTCNAQRAGVIAPDFRRPEGCEQCGRQGQGGRRGEGHPACGKVTGCRPGS
jgi:hypothetical protein